MSTFKIFLYLCCSLLMPYEMAQAASYPLNSATGGTTVRIFLQENLDVKGRQVPIDAELARVLGYFERGTGLRFELVSLPWKRAQLETLQGNGIIYGFSKSVERLAHYDYSLPVITERIWAITYGDALPTIERVEDLRGKVISIGRGFSHGLEFDQARDIIFTVQEDSATAAARFKKLMLGRSDLMLWPVREFETSRQVEQYIHKKLVPEMNDPDLNGKIFKVSTKPIFFDTIHFSSAKGKYAKELEKIDNVIKKGTENGELAKVLKGYH